jgi:hypothetical protein
MAYPLAKVPTYAEFRGRLEKELYCKHLKADGKLKDPQGNEHDICYFEREVSGKTLRVAAPDLKDDEHVLWSVVRSVCNRLQVDLAAFGLDIG